MLLLVFLAFELVAGLLFMAVSVSSKSMAPTIAAEDRLLATPLLYGPATFLGKLPALVKPARGDIALIDPPYAERPAFLAAVTDALLRFLTFQRFSPLAAKGSALKGPFIERVIALPGDTVEMEDFIFKVKTSESGHFLTEFELSEHRYDISKPDLPQGWSEDYPLSGRMRPIVLGKDEYFVAGDNRGASSDSRLWGPIGKSHFKAKALLRYWPFRHFGLP